MNLQAVWRNVVYEIMIDTRFDMYTELLSESLELQKILELLTSLSVPIEILHIQERANLRSMCFLVLTFPRHLMWGKIHNNFTQILIP